MMRIVRIMLAAFIVAGFATAAHAARPVSMMRDAQDAYLGGRFDDALKLYEQAWDESDGDLSVLYNVAMAKMGLGRIDESVQSFENVAAKANVNVKLRQDALFNIGVLRATHARGRLAQLHSPASQTAEDANAAATQPSEPPTAELSIEELESVAAELLGAIDFFSKARNAGANPDDVEHNIRAARATRREVLGLIREAREAARKKQEEEALKDPQAYLAALIAEQRTQASVSRHLDRHPAENPSQQRRRRRIALRMQRDTMRRTTTLADHLQQFTETADQDDTATTTTQPAAESPKERLFHEAARRLEPVLDHQRDAGAFLLEGRIATAHVQQRDAVRTLREVEALFPLDPAAALARWHGEQHGLSEMVSRFETSDDWQHDPALPRTEDRDAASQPATQPVTVEPEDLPIHDLQEQIGLGLARLATQANRIAEHAPAPTSAPANAPAQKPDPRTDPELNRRLAEVLATAETPHTRCLAAMVEMNRDAALSAQEELTTIIRKALDLFPKSLEERLQALIARQGQLNAETTAVTQSDNADASGNDADATSSQTSGSRLLGKLKTLVSSPAAVTEALSGKQNRIETDTRQIEGDIKQQATTMASGQDGTQNPRVQALIESGRHVGEADRRMLSAVEELNTAAVESALTRLKAEGPVPKAQTAALEALIRALQALQPPQDQEQEDQQQDSDSKKEEENKPQPRQDIRRAMERLDKEREKAEQKLYRSRPTSVGKDW